MLGLQLCLAIEALADNEKRMRCCNVATALAPRGGGCCAVSTAPNEAAQRLDGEQS